MISLEFQCGVDLKSNIMDSLNGTDSDITELSQIQKWLSYYLNGPATSFLVAMGLVLNMVSIVIFMRPQRQRRPCIYYYLITLALWDSVLLLNAFALYSFPTCYFGHKVWYGNDYVYIYPVVYTVSNITLIGSVWIVMALTVDRYFALCQPLTHKAIGKKTRVKKLLFLVSVMATLFGMPRCFELNVITSDVGNGTIVAHVAPTNLTKSDIYMIGYRVLGGLIFYSLVPFVLLFCITIRITIAISKASRRRGAMSLR